MFIIHHHASHFQPGWHTLGGQDAFVESVNEQEKERINGLLNLCFSSQHPYFRIKSRSRIQPCQGTSVTEDQSPSLPVRLADQRKILFHCCLKQLSAKMPLQNSLLLGREIHGKISPQFQFKKGNLKSVACRMEPGQPDSAEELMLLGI